MQWISPDSQDLDLEVQGLLHQIALCKDGGNTAHCLWVESQGLDGKTLEVVLKHGLTKTILAWGDPQPVSLCGKCSAKRISGILGGEGFFCFEVCSPHGAEEGIVLPMSY